LAPPSLKVCLGRDCLVMVVDVRDRDAQRIELFDQAQQLGDCGRFLIARLRRFGPHGWCV